MIRDEQRDYEAWCRWIDDRVMATPWPVAVGVWIGIALIALL